jgi:hypothetical protein
MPGYTYSGIQSGHKIYENTNYVPMGFTYDTYMTKEYCDSQSEHLRASLMLKAVLLDEKQVEKYSDRLSFLNTEGYFAFDDNELAADCTKLAQNSAKSFAYTGTGFKAQIDADKDTLAFFSVPFEAGWSATVNGKKAPVEKVNVGFMAVPVNAGQNKIEFTYTTPGLSNGIIITLGSTLIFIIYIIICAATKKRRMENSEIIYPEGDMLIDKWVGYDADDAVMDNEILDDGDITTLDMIAENLNSAYPVAKNNLDNGFKVNLGNEDVDK